MTPDHAPLSRLGARFLVPAGLAVLAKLALVSDLSVQIAYFPHDDSLYVERAFQMLHGNAFGPYDSRILAKYPGLSFWLWGMRHAGIPFLLSVNALYIAAGAYFCAALRRCGFGHGLVLAAFVLYLFNPVTLGFEWIRVLREPVVTGLLVFLLAAALHVAVSLDERRAGLMHALVFALAFASTLYFREEDSLLWLLLGLFGALWAWRGFSRGVRPERAVTTTVVLATVGAAFLGLSAQYAIRGFVERNYGAPLIHDMSEGEFPRLIAAIRSVESAKDNRLVMVPQDVLQKLRAQVPEFRPVVDKLPPVGPRTFSCLRYGICSEWANGWMPFWIKDAAFFAGLTPDLPRGQEYFRKIRLQIEAACASGALRCRVRGEGLVPPMELRWTRAYVREGLHLAALTLYPEVNAVDVPPLRYGVAPDLAKRFQVVTMTDYLGPLTGFDFSERRLYARPGAERTRPALARAYEPVAALLLVVALGAMAYRLVVSGRTPLDPFSGIAAAFTLYLGLRLAALAYVAVYFGNFDSRIAFSTYIAGVLIAVPVIAGAVAAWRSRSDAVDLEHKPT